MFVNLHKDVLMRAYPENCICHVDLACRDHVVRRVLEKKRADLEPRL